MDIQHGNPREEEGSVGYKFARFDPPPNAGPFTRRRWLDAERAVLRGILRHERDPYWRAAAQRTLVDVECDRRAPLMRLCNVLHLVRAMNALTLAANLALWLNRDTSHNAFAAGIILGGWVVIELRMYIDERYP